MNTEISKTTEFNKFVNQFTDKRNLETPNNKNIGLVNISIYYTWKTLNLHPAKINLKFQLQLRLINFICLIVRIQFLTFKMTLNLSSKNMKLWLKIVPLKFTPIKSKTGSFLK